MGDLSPEHRRISHLERLKRKVLAPWPLWVGGTVFALLNILFFLINGEAWGISTGLARWGSWFLYRVGVSVEQWTFWQQEGWHHPLADIEGWVNLGVIVGAFLAAAATREFKIKRPRSLFPLFIGGYLMGYGARVGDGCNIGGFYTALTSLSISGWLFAAAMFSGVFVGSRILLRRLGV